MMLFDLSGQITIWGIFTIIWWLPIGYSRRFIHPKVTYPTSLEWDSGSKKTSK